MIKFKRSKRAVANDTRTLTDYCNGKISKSQAIREICSHNKIYLISEEEFDKEIKSLGWYVKHEYRNYR